MELSESIAAAPGFAAGVPPPGLTCGSWRLPLFFFPLSFNSYSYSMRGKRNYHSISSIFCVFSLCLKFSFSLVPTKTLEWHTENKNENRMRLKWKEMEEAARIRILCLLRR